MTTRAFIPNNDTPQSWGLLAVNSFKLHNIVANQKKIRLHRKNHVSHNNSLYAALCWERDMAPRGSTLQTQSFRDAEPQLIIPPKKTFKSCNTTRAAQTRN